MLTLERSNPNYVDKDRSRSFTMSRDARYRTNVLELLDVFAKPAITCYMFLDVNMEWVENQRIQFASMGHKVTATAILLKAIAIAQKNHPASRTQYIPGFRTVTYNQIVAGFTVEREVDGKPFVFFGEIEDADVKAVPEIAAELSDYSHLDIAKLPKLKEQIMFAKLPWIIRRLLLTLALWVPRVRLLCMRSTFGLSSLGALGVQKVSGPSVCTSVFGVGEIKERVIAKQGKVAIGPMMTLSLSFDHRAMDAGRAARFFKEVNELLQGKLSDY